MQNHLEKPQVKNKRGGMTKYERVKARILVFIAVLLVSQAVVNVGSIVHFHVTWNEAFLEEQDTPYCICQEAGVFYDGSNKE